ncbi:MAG: hypothetical protein ACI8UZ_002858 [Akkermansiaceae bacterium]|jgi:hypothetical protein
MALILAFQHPVLGFCGCSHDFFLADCECSPPLEDECSCCSEVCDSCLSPASKKAPCQDCCKKISCDPGDILWAPRSGPEAFTGAELAPIPLLGICFLSQGSVTYFPIAPPRPPPDSCPLFLRFGVFRL